MLEISDAAFLKIFIAKIVLTPVVQKNRVVRQSLQREYRQKMYGNLDDWNIDFSLDNGNRNKAESF